MAPAVGKETFADATLTTKLLKRFRAGDIEGVPRILHYGGGYPTLGTFVTTASQNPKVVNG